MKIPKIFIVVLYGLLSFTAQAQNVSSISRYSGPTLTFSPPKNVTSSTVISSACDFPVTLTQSGSQTITSGISISCKYNVSGYHAENHYWRAFSLTKDFNVTQIEIGVQQAAASSGSQPITVNVYENTGGNFPAGVRTLKGTASTSVPNQSLTILSVPVAANIASNTQMIIEILVPDGQTAMNSFYVGTNKDGETGTSYFSAAACNISIVPYSNYNGHPIVMNVIGCESPDIYVNAGVGSGGDGTSWNNAYNSLQDAMDAANTGDEIWVASGTYKPTKDHTGSTSPTDPRDKNFHLAKDLKIYGGFAGYETLFSDRNTKANETILSGDFNGDDVISGSGATLSISDTSENAYHVLILANLTSNAVIDGLTIKGGNASGQVGDNFTFASRTFSRYYGGGVYLNASSPRFANLIISGNGANYAAGMYAINSSSPNISNTLFKLNLAYTNGGGFALTLSSSTINNSVFTGNKTILGTGGGIYNERCNTTVTNSTFVGNSSASKSAGIINWNTTETLTISNCIFWGNTYNGGGSSSGIDIHAVTTSPIVSNCMTQFYTAGTNLIIGQNPVFKDSANGDFQITPCSPAVNTGNNALWNATGLSGDYEGNTRPFGGTVDIGAYECQTSPFLTALAIYVKWNAGGNNDGTSWANAFNNLQDALDNQCGGLDIWVAAGTYLPTSDHSDNNAPQSNPLKTFHLKKDMKIYGGFLGGETLLSERDWKLHETILSGDFNDDDVVSGNGSTLSIASITDNAYHVLITADLSNNAVLDGFTIKGGNFGNGQGTIFYASKSYVVEEGAGMYNYQSSPTIKNVVFTGNSAKKGGGMKNEFSSPKISYASFTKNLVSELGGGMYNISSSPLVINTTFFANSAKFGGGMFNYASSPVITNVTFSGNAASYSAGGGGMYNQLGSAPVITNSIFWNNTQGGNNNTYGADINVNSSTPSITYSLTQESSYYSSGTGIINNQNPQFLDAPNGDLRLKGCSPAINTGDNAAWATRGLSTDLEGNARPFGTSVVDMGAYEFQGNNPFTNAIYVKHNASGDNDGSSWANAYKDFQVGIDNQCGSLPIWVAAGTYYPTAGTDRTISFAIPDGVKLYGGFAGTETLLAQRDWTTHETILSGDIGIQNDNTDNSNHVVYTKNVSSETLMDGFIVSDGQINGYGGGWLNDGFGSGNSSNPTLSNCTFLGNSAGYGGAMYNNGSSNGDSSPTLNNCTFLGNTAAYEGGAMYNSGGAWSDDGSSTGDSSPTLNNCTFSDNSAGSEGGAMYNYGKEGVSSPTLSDCSFLGNSVAENGGAIFNNGRNGVSSPTLSNCTFLGNLAENGGALYTYSQTAGVSRPILNDCVFSDNSAMNGGAIYFRNDGGSVKAEVINCTFQDNGNDHIGYDDGDPDTQPHFINCTFSGATAYAINIEWWGEGQTPLDFTNCIFWGNNGDILGGDEGTDNARLNIINSIVEEAAFAPANNNINQNPQFLDAANGFLQLKCNSPAINQGTATGAPSDDITGFIRVGLPDTGAYEYGQTVVDIQIPNGTNPSLNGIPILKASSQILNTNTVLFQGVNNVQLLPGFSVAPTGGAATVFRAEIGGGCEYEEE
jgi:hypothetical protein